MPDTKFFKKTKKLTTIGTVQFLKYLKTTCIIQQIKASVLAPDDVF